MHPTTRRPAGILAAAVLVIALGVLLPACFYAVPDPLPPAPPGALIRSEPVTVPGLNGTAWRVMYHSRSIKGADIAVTGLVFGPTNTAAPPGGYPVVSWAHGSKGFADGCAPSADPTTALSLQTVNAVLGRGWALTATDYEGLGTPGRHPKFVGVSEARGAIDIVRAAHDLSVDVYGADHLSPDYVVWGNSQGGRATMFALRDAESWAPELDLVGAVAAGVPADLDAVLPVAIQETGPFHVLVPAAGINAAYGDADAPLDEILTPDGIAALADADTYCNADLKVRWSALEVDAVLKQQADGTRNPLSNPVWGPLLRAQDPIEFTAASPTPLLIVQGGADDTTPAFASEALRDHLCSASVGQDLQYWLYPDGTHTSVMTASRTDTLTWMGHRFAGQAWPDPYTPTGHPNVQATTCS